MQPHSELWLRQEPGSLGECCCGCHPGRALCVAPWGPPAPPVSASDGDVSYSTARDSPATAEGWRDKQRTMVRKKKTTARTARSWRGSNWCSLTENILWWGHLVWIHILEEFTAQGLFSCTALAGVQVQHVIKQVQRRQGDAAQEKNKKRLNMLQGWILTLMYFYPHNMPKLTKQTLLAAVSCTASLVSLCWRREALLHLARQQDRGCHIFG